MHLCLWRREEAVLRLQAVVLKHQEVVLGHQESRQEFIAVFKVVFPEAANTFYSI